MKRIPAFFVNPGMKLSKWILPALATALLWAQSPLPDTPAGSVLTRWLSVFNAGQRPTMAEFLEKYFDPKRIDNMLQFREMTGGFDLKKVEDAKPTEITGIVKERESDTYGRFVIGVDAAEPHKITRFELRAIPRPGEFPAAPRLSEKEALDALRGRLDDRTAADRFSGAALVAKEGKPIFAEAYGLADRESKTANKLDTQFRIGSMNKMFTATAVLQLAQAGKLKLTDTLATILPDYPNADLASKVTVHHLLTHTGGTGDIFGPEFEKNRLKLRTLQDYVTLYGKRALKFEPGSRWEYSNYGFLLLGVIVEKVSGKTYYDYVRENIFKPAGMTRTDSLPEEEKVAARSTGYMRREGLWTPNTDTLPWRGTSAGGGYSTVEDLARFADALRTHKLLNAEYTSLLTTGKVETGPNGKYAYGFMDRNDDGVHWFGHGGGAPGMNGELKIFPDSGYVVAVLANLDPPAAGKIADFIAAKLPATR